MDVLFLLAQNADPLSGGAGWIGAGLLGLVLSWLLLKHLPEKDKMILGIIERYEVRQEQQRTQHSETIFKLGQSINAAVEKVTAHCKEELEFIANRMDTSAEKMQEALGKVIARKLKESP